MTVNGKTTLDPQFTKMISVAKETVSNDSLNKDRFCQCIVLQSSGEKEKAYYFSCGSVDELADKTCSVLEEIRLPVQRIVCMWGNGEIEVPSGRFLKALCSADPENKKATVLLKAGPNAFSTKTVEEIIG